MQRRDVTRGGEKWCSGTRTLVEMLITMIPLGSSSSNELCSLSWWSGRTYIYLPMALHCIIHLASRQLFDVLRRSKAPHHQFHPWKMRNGNMIGLKPMAFQPLFQQLNGPRNDRKKKKQIAGEPASTSFVYGLNSIVSSKNSGALKT